MRDNLLRPQRSISEEIYIHKPTLLRAIDVGLSTARNVSKLRNIAPLTERSSPSFFHARNQKPNDDVQQLGDLAIHSAMAASYLMENSCK